MLATLVRHPALTEAYLSFNVYMIVQLDPAGAPARARDPAGRDTANCEYEWTPPRRIGRRGRPAEAEISAAAGEGAHRTSTARPCAQSTSSNLTTPDCPTRPGRNSRRPPRRTAADGSGLHSRLLLHARYGLQHLRRPSSKHGKVNPCPTSPSQPQGSWTEQYPELGTGPVDYTDSIDPSYYEAEREAIFKRTWLNVGRVERLPRRRAATSPRSWPSPAPR